jgi:hypothetical protein
MDWVRRYRYLFWLPPVIVALPGRIVFPELPTGDCRHNSHVGWRTSLFWLSLFHGFFFLIARVISRTTRGGEPPVEASHHVGICVQCGYNLTGNVSGVCPECGLTIEKPLT